MILLCLLLSDANAERLDLRVALDDRRLSRYTQPVLRLNGTNISFADDGAVPGDVPGDGIWVASVSIDRQESIEVVIRDSGLPEFSMMYTLPESGVATLQLKSQNGDIPLAIDQNAPVMPEEGPAVVQTLLVRAAPINGADAPENNQQEVRFLVDDRGQQKLKEPRVRINQAGVAMAPLVDDGRVLGDTPNDGIYHAKLLITPAEQVVLTIEDQGVVLGQVTLTLPSEKVVGAGVQLGAGGLQLLSQISTMGATEVVPLQVVPTEQVGTNQVSSNMVIQAFAKEGLAPVELIDGKATQWLDIMLSSETPLVMPTLGINDQSVLLSDDGSQTLDTPNDGIYLGRVLVERGAVLESELIVDGTTRGALTIFLPDSGLAQAVATLTDSGLVPFERLDALQQSEADLPKVFQAAGKAGTEIDIRSKEGQKLNFELLLKGALSSPPNVDVLAGDRVLKKTQLESDSEDVWTASFELPREDIWQLKFKLDTAEVETYLISPNFSTATLGLVWTGTELNILDDVSLLSDASSHDELRVLRARALDDSEVNILEGAPISLNIILDDRAGKMVRDAQLWVVGAGKEPKFVRDDGLNGDEQPKDEIYSVQLDTLYQPMIQLGFKNGDDESLTHVVMLPAANPSQLRALVTPNGLTTVEAKNADTVIKAPLVVQAAPTGVDVQEGDGENFIEVTMILDDRILQKLSAPRIRVLQNETLIVNLGDEGTEADEVEGDSIYSGVFSVEQSEFMKVAVDDDGVAVGQMTVFLPSSSSARIRMRTTDDEAGLKLLTEAIATGGGKAPTPVISMGGDSGVGVDRLAHVLWVGLTMFGLTFAYIRHVIYTKWTSEIAPLLRRVDAFISKSESLDESEDKDA